MASLLDYVQVDGVGHLLPYESVPLWEDKLLLHDPDPEWIWVYREGGAIKGVLVCAPVHGLVLLLRLRTYEPEDKTAVLKILRRASRECRERGYVCFIVFANKERPQEGHLLALAERFGALSEENLRMGAGMIPESL